MSLGYLLGLGLKSKTLPLSFLLSLLILAGLPDKSDLLDLRVIPVLFIGLTGLIQGAEDQVNLIGFGVMLRLLELISNISLLKN